MSTAPNFEIDPDLPPQLRIRPWVTDIVAWRKRNEERAMAARAQHEAAERVKRTRASGRLPDNATEAERKAAAEERRRAMGERVASKKPAARKRSDRVPLYKTYSREQLEQLYVAEEKSIKAIALELEVSTDTITRALVHLGIPLRPTRRFGAAKVTEDDAATRDEVIKRYVAGHSVRAISNDLHIGQRRVLVYISEAGVALRTSNMRELYEQHDVTFDEVRDWCKATGRPVADAGQPASHYLFEYLKDRKIQP